jgi:SAM-dependent methyltransferase
VRTEHPPVRNPTTALFNTAGATPTEVRYGPDIATEADLRLLGDLAGKRVLELGWAGAPSSIAFARQGAVAIAVDSSAQQLAAARRQCEREGIRVELHHGDLADLAFVRADSIDVVFSAFAFALVEDLNRVFRQVHRVLKPNAPLVFSLPHPVYDTIDDGDPHQPLLVRRSYFDRSPIQHDAHGGSPALTYHHTVAAVSGGLVRAGYRVDAILEPEPSSSGPRSPQWREAFRFLPRTLVVRGRKEGA